jgi:hypothetical protein
MVKMSGRLIVLFTVVLLSTLLAKISIAFFAIMVNVYFIAAFAYVY